MMDGGPLARLAGQGVSIWLDTISRDRLAAGGLARLVDGRHVTGVTSNPWQGQCLTRHAYYGCD